MEEKGRTDIRVRKKEDWERIFEEYRKAHKKLKEIITEKNKDIQKLNYDKMHLRGEIRKQKAQIELLTKELKKYTLK